MRKFLIGLLVGLLLLVGLVPSANASPVEATIASTTSANSMLTSASMATAASVLPNRKCIGTVCIAGGHIKASAYTKTTIQVANGIDWHGRPYGYAVALRLNQSSKAYMEDADIAYLSSRQIAAGYKLYLLVYNPQYGNISVRVDARGYKVPDGTTKIFTAQK